MRKFPSCGSISMNLHFFTATVTHAQELCQSVADKYIEFELVLLVLDLALHKVQAYRHLLYNRLPYCDLGVFGVRPCHGDNPSLSCNCVLYSSRDVGSEKAAIMGRSRSIRRQPYVLRRSIQFLRSMLALTTRSCRLLQFLRVMLALTVLDTHIKYAVYVYSSGAGATPDPNDNPEYQLHLIMRIYLLSVVEHLVSPHAGRWRGQYDLEGPGE
jgi:hypothetical protein